MSTVLDLPPLDADARRHCDRVTEAVLAAIRAADGWLPFRDYMALVLYAPGLGYYTAGARKFGAAGDFVTAPELSPLFADCLAQEVGGLLATLGQADVLEFGAGSGALCVDLLRALERQGQVPARYRILEVSADLRERQRERVLRELPAALAARVEWLDRLPDADWQGVIVANEVLDALPVERFRITASGCERLGVVATPQGLAFEARAADAALEAAVQALDATLESPLPVGYVSEVDPRLAPWLAAATQSLRRGVLLVIDYGYSRADYYAPDRSGGTLSCFFRHRVHDDPLVYPGLQDITAWVDFTAVAEAAVAAGLEVAGYATQAQVLLSLGIDRALAARTTDADERTRLTLAAAANTLLLPAEMGEKFKVMALTRDYEEPLAGFAFRDLTRTL